MKITADTKKSEKNPEEYQLPCLIINKWGAIILLSEKMDEKKYKGILLRSAYGAGHLHLKTDEFYTTGADWELYQGEVSLRNDTGVVLDV